MLYRVELMHYMASAKGGGSNDCQEAARRTGAYLSDMPFQLRDGNLPAVFYLRTVKERKEMINTFL